MMRFWACLLAWLCLAGTAAAADVKPQVNYAGQLQPVKPGDTLGVPNGGTSSTSLTAHCVLVGAGTSPPHTICPVIIGDMLTDNGPGVDPSYQPAGNPLCLGTSLACINFGAGAPTRTDLGTGSIYCDTSSGQCYSYFGPQTPPARVQEISTGVGGYTFTLPGAPTIGNYIFATCWAQNSLPTLTATFTQIGTSWNSSKWFMISGYHKVIGGDTATMTPCSGGSGFTGSGDIEVSGISSTAPSGNIQFVSPYSNNINGGNTINYTTTTPNTLAISTAMSSATGVMTFSGSTWTHQSVAGTINSSGIASSAFSPNNAGITAITANSAQSSFPNPETAVLIVLQPSNPMTTGWQTINYLQTQASGAVVDTFPRALNFGSGLSVSVANGVDTITTTGTVGTTGSPVNGNLSCFSGAATITNCDLSGDVTTSGSSATTVSKIGGVAVGTFATQNFATPPAIGGTTPAAGAFTTLSATGNLTTNVTGSTQCVQVNTSGVVSGTGSACGSASGAAIHGTPTAGNCTSWFNATTIQDAGAACGGGGGGSPGGSTNATQYNAGGGTFGGAGPGTSGQVLTSNGSGSAPTFQAPAMVLISQTVTSGSQASVTVSGIPGTYRDLWVVVDGRTSVAGTDGNIDIQFNGDTGSNYYANDTWSNSSNTIFTFGGGGAAQTSALIGAIPGNTAPSNMGGPVHLNIGNYAGTTFTKSGITSGGILRALSATNYFTEVGAINWNSTAAITSLKVFPASGNFIDGTVVSVYGIGS